MVDFPHAIYIPHNLPHYYMHWYGEAGDLSTDTAACEERVLNTTTIPSVLCNWEDLRDAGLISSRDEYIRAVREVTFSLAEKASPPILTKKMPLSSRWFGPSMRWMM